LGAKGGGASIRANSLPSKTIMANVSKMNIILMKSNKFQHLDSSGQNQQQQQFQQIAAMMASENMSSAEKAVSQIKFQLN
jgi:hypothetical protein